jgi:hypothetical protein
MALYTSTASGKLHRDRPFFLILELYIVYIIQGVINSSIKNV